jgi:hypothetical protein
MAATYLPDHNRIVDIDILSSSRVSISTSSSTNFDVKLASPIEGVTAIQLYEVILPKVQYNITAANNVFYYNATSVTVPPGAYSAASLMTALNALLTGPGIVVSFSNVTLKTTLTSGVIVTYPFGTNTANSITSVLGFTAVDLAGNTVYTSTQGINLTGKLSMYINVRGFSNGSTTTGNLGYFTFKVPLVSEGAITGDYIVWRANDYYGSKVIIPAQSITTLHIDLMYSDGTAVDMLGYDWSMLLHCYCP